MIDIIIIKSFKYYKIIVKFYNYKKVKIKDYRQGIEKEVYLLKIKKLLPIKKKKLLKSNKMV